MPALDKMAGEIVVENYDDEDDTLDAGAALFALLSICVWRIIGSWAVAWTFETRYASKLC